MLPCLVKCRSHPRYPSRLGNLFAAPRYIPTSLPHLLPLPSSHDEKSVTATPLHSVLTPYWLKSFSCNTYGTPRKCCKQRTYGLAKPFRCNTYKKHGGKGSRLWLTRNPIGIAVLSNHQERRSTCVPTHVAPRITNRESPPDGLPPSLPDATIWYSMTPANPQPSTAHRPRVGIPWRASDDEDKARTAGPAGKIGKTEDYLKAVEKAGGEGIVITLKDREERSRLIPTLDAYVLPGSQADIEPGEYGSINRGLSAPADPLRDETDRAILKHALAEKKPVLAICYGCQLLNVYLGGTLIQDLRSELGTTTPHRKKDAVPERKDDPIHGATFEPGSRLASIASSRQAEINSSHHQAIEKPGQNLRVAAHATDGVIEGVEWTGDSNWVLGVQWHPERMAGDPFSERLFSDFIAAARGAIALKV